MKRSVILISIAVLSPALTARETKIADQFHSYFIANYKHFGKQFDQALSWYQRTLSLESPVYANKGLIHLLHETNNDPIIVKLRSTIEQYFANDVELQFILAKAQSAVGNEAEAQDLLIKLNQQAKTNQEIAFHTAQIYLQRKEPENALRVIDNLLNNTPRKPTHFIFHFLKSQIYMQMNKKEEALASIYKTLELHPRFDKAWLMRALLEEKMGNIENAIKGYTNFLEIVGPHEEIEQHLVSLTFKQNNPDYTAAYQDPAKETLDRAISLFDQGKYREALTAIDTFLANAQQHNEAKLLKIQILCAMNDTTGVLENLKKWSIQDAENLLWFNTLHLLYRNGIDQRVIIKTLHEIEKGSPESLLPLLYLADMYIRNNGPQAVTYLQRCLRAAQNTALKAELAFQLCAHAYNHHNYKLLKETFATYEPLLGEHAPTQNLMAYYYLSKERNSTRAQEFLQKALLHDPTNPHIKDTQALLHYHAKEYAKALEILQEIAQQEPNDYTIIKHLAKTYYKQGNIPQAQATIKQLLPLIKDDKKQKKYQHRLVAWTKK